MRVVPVVLLLVSLGSIQLPWVFCEQEYVHLDMGHSDSDHRDSDHRDDEGGSSHEPLEWSAVPHTAPAPATVAAHALVGVGTPVLPDARESAATRDARAVAPPFAVASRTTVLLL